MRKHLLPCFVIGLIVAMLSGCSAPQKAKPRPELVFPTPPDEARFYFQQTIRSSGDIIQSTEDEQMMYFLTGAGRLVEVFAKPFDIAVHKGRIFMSDTANRDVFLMDRTNNRFIKLSDKSPVKFNKPMGLATDAAGNVYIVDITQKSIFIFDRDGNFQKRIEAEEHLARPSGIDVTPDGSIAYIVNVGGVSSEQHNIAVINLVTGELINTIGTRGPGDGELNLPKDVAIGNDGLLYIVDSGNFRVSVFTQEGEFVKNFGKIGTQHGSFSRPKGIAIDPDGHIYVVDAGFGNFQIFNTEGQLLLFVGERSARGDRAQYMLPAGIDVDEDGRIFMVDQYLRKVEVYRPATLAKEAGYFTAKKPPPAAQ
ncbi:MAG: 6-bladed beta-propeller [Halopseudomonas sp.]